MPTLNSLPIDLALISHADDVFPDDGARIRTPFKLSPAEYLSFAERDLEGKSTRANLNALHNAKRAIGCSIDSVLWNYGYAGALRDNFGVKVERIRQMGLISPRIIRRLLHTRNLVEHGYETVTPEEAEDAVEVAMLFSLALQPFSTCRYDEVCFSNYTENYHGNLLWLYPDGMTVPVREHSPERREEVLRTSPIAIFFEIFRRASGREEDHECNALFGRFTDRWDEARLLKRGLIEVGFGSIRNSEPDYPGLVKVFVKAITNTWVWSD
jgi:hypothetical protein